MVQVPDQSLTLKDGATVAVLGGGPAGTFSAIHLKRQARKHGRNLRVLVFEQNCPPGDSAANRLWGPYSGCPKCAGGLSPPLCDALRDLDISISQDVIQSDVSSITVQGSWKSVVMPVPRDRKMLSVYRGTLPYGQHREVCFDAMLQSVAIDSGAELIGGRIIKVEYDDSGGINLSYQAGGSLHQLCADFVIFAGGVNEKPERDSDEPNAVELLQRLQPEYVPPSLRKSLIFELSGSRDHNDIPSGQLRYIESSSGHLKLEMCSILSKSGYLTVSLVGKSVDASSTHQQNLQVIHDFLDLPQIQRALPPRLDPRIRCVCNPKLVVGTARSPFGDRVAAVGDMATCRLYKDGILSSHNMARALATTLFEQGIDHSSLARGYGPAIEGFRRDNRYAQVIFFLYRWFFTSPAWSRVIYQTYASEKKSKPESERSFKRIFWAISSGDGAYRDIAWSMLRPRTIWTILSGGLLVTFRNRVAELLFGLHWSDIERVPTVVSRRELAVKRLDLTMKRNVLPEADLPEFECIYAVPIRAPAERVWGLLAAFGEPHRPYLNPRWVTIRRSRGEPLQPGNVIDYRVLGGLIRFSIKQQAVQAPGLLVYRVRNGFAHGGHFIFEVLSTSEEECELTIYLAFDYARGNGAFSRVYYYLFRKLFPEFIHDVLWNHALCELREHAELAAGVDLQATQG